jgi:putative transposase
MLKSDYRRGPHTTYEIHLHLVWVTKYRRPVLRGEVGERLREIIRELCAADDVSILKGHVARDHVHLFLSIPPQVTISRLVQRLKGKSSYKLLAEYSKLKKKFWGRHLCARGYFVCSSGNVTDEVIAAYIEQQTEQGGTDDGFRVEAEDVEATQPPLIEALEPRAARPKADFQSASRKPPPLGGGR